MATLFEKDDDDPKPKGKLVTPAKARQAPKKAAPPKKKPAAKPIDDRGPQAVANALAAKAGTAVAIHKPRPPAAPKINSAMSMLSFIGTAAQDPTVNPEKMQALLDIRKQLKAEEAADAYNAALLKLMKEIATIRITKKGLIQIFGKNDPDHRNNPIQSTKYSKYEDLNRIIRPILHKHGFVLQHRNASAPDGKPITITSLLHAGGHRVESEFMGEIDASGSKNNVQGRGSTLSYGKRYNTVSLLDIITEEDDDGNQGAGDPVSAAQLDDIVKACEFAGADKALLAKHLGIERLADIPARKFQDVLALIARKKAAST